LIAGSGLALFKRQRAAHVFRKLVVATSYSTRPEPYDVHSDVSAEGRRFTQGQATCNESLQRCTFDKRVGMLF
jgi:hypothetical protein